MEIDFYILDFIQKYLCNPIADVIMPFITKFGDAGIFWMICTALLLIIPKTRKLGATMLISLAIEALCCNVILKPLVARTRPYDINQTIHIIINKPTDFSFPSGHTGVSFAAASAIFFSGNKLGIPSLFFAALIGFSRLYLYVHYPTDVLAGAIIGLLTGFIAVRIVTAYEARYAKLSE